jgi:hypothetical protein
MTNDPKTSVLSYEVYLKNLAQETDRLAGKGEPVAVDPEVADYMGAFEEDAISAEDALDSIEVNGEVDYNG